MQRKPEGRHALGEHRPHAFGVLLAPEAHHEVVRVPNQPRVRVKPGLTVCSNHASST
jgi:hypothetical protein